jgi:nitronate monooxygenase
MTTQAWRERLGLRWPLIQAPMAGVQDHELAIAVAQAGALGSVPAAMLSPQALKASLQAVKAAGVASVNVNFFCHRPQPVDAARHAAWREALAPSYAEWGLDPAAASHAASREPFNAAMLEVLESFHPRVVSFHFGLPPASLVAPIKRLGALIVSSATTVAEARWLEQHGADIIVAQGLEAGGHRGMFLSEDLSTQLSTFALVPLIVDAIKLPVIAAGGIADARSVTAAIALGASGVQVGTAFLACHEATTSAVHRQALKGEHANTTALTNIFTGRPARGIVNRVMREHGLISQLAPPFPQAAAALAPLRVAAEARGDGSYSPLWSGQRGCPYDDEPAAMIVEHLVAGMG